MRAYHRLVSATFVLLFVVCCFLTGTMAWQNIGQSAKNEASGDRTMIDVELIKLERDIAGSETTTPIPDAVFLLFTSADEQVGGSYTTDADGKILLSLEPGEYYFTEQYPGANYTFDGEQDGTDKTEYPFTVTGTEEETVTVTAYNQRLSGSLEIEKTVENADGSPLTDEQKQKEFTLTVTFSDGGTYEYAVDDGVKQQLVSGGTLVLRHGQRAVFDKLPAGILYHVAETPEEGYVIHSTGHQGNITKDGCVAAFTNTYAPQEERTGSLAITKEIIDESADHSANLEQEFEFTVTFSDGGTYEYSVDNGVKQQLVSGGTLKLKAGQSAVFEGIPVGVTYTVTEAFTYMEESFAAHTDSFSGTIVEEGVTLPFVNVYMPVPPWLPGSLTITKEVPGENPNPEQEFEFTVTFSNNETYAYRIDGGEEQELLSGGTLKLKHGQSAVFDELPADLGYTVEETDAGGYTAAVEQARGAILGGQNAVLTFRNIPQQEPEEPAKITVTKTVTGEIPEADQDKAFAFTITIDGKETEFTLKDGETREFEAEQGASYEVREADYSADGYSQAIVNGIGVVNGQTIEVTATNTYAGRPLVTVEGEKTWELGEYAGTVTLPESITVRLKNGALLVEEQEVTPDGNGEWHYSFTAPKYDAEDMEIAYTVEELPVESFVATYDGTNITNTYLPPVEIDPPMIEKMVEGENTPQTQFSFLLKGQAGAPMPEGSSGNNRILTRNGAGEVEIGSIAFAEPGVYTYTISELNHGEKGWSYDDTIYTLTITVTLKDGELRAEKALIKNGEAVQEVLFTNVFDESLVEPETVEIAGTKTWEHGENPNPPEAIVVYVYADGELAVQRQVTAKDNWQYAFTLPRRAADGHEIVYTIGEAKIEGYEAKVNGYDLVNVYTDEQEEPKPTPTPTPGPDQPTPGPSQKPTQPGSNPPKTGDTSNPWIWIALMAAGAIGIVVSLVVMRIKPRKRYKGKHTR